MIGPDLAGSRQWIGQNGVAADGTDGCVICASRRSDGSLTDGNVSHCRHCHRTWGRNTRQAHCATCHEHFTTPGNFDAHLAPVAWQGEPCRPPGAVVSKAGEPKLRLRDDGVWCGAGEYDREAVA